MLFFLKKSLKYKKNYIKYNSLQKYNMIIELLIDLVFQVGHFLK